MSSVGGVCILNVIAHYNSKEGYSAGERTTGSTEDGERLCRTSTKGQERLARRGSGEAIITKKRFVPDKFFTMCM